MRDHAYDQIPYRAAEMPHRYGSGVHILAENAAREGRRERRKEGGREPCERRPRTRAKPLTGD